MLYILVFLLGIIQTICTVQEVTIENHPQQSLQRLPARLSSLSHTGVIQCTIHPWKKDLQKQLEETRSTTRNEEPIKNPVSKDALDAYLLSQQAPFHNLEYEIARKILRRSMIGVGGIFCYYKGYVVLSDDEGKILLPRLEQKRELIVVITPTITPVQLRGVQPIYFTIPKSTPAQWYRCTGTEKNENTLLEWRAAPIQTSDTKIPSSALIIIADPKSLIFDDQALTVPFSENIILPDLFATQELTRGIYSLSALEDLRYFRGLPFVEKESMQQPGIQYAKHITDNEDMGISPLDPV